MASIRSSRRVSPPSALDAADGAVNAPIGSGGAGRFRAATGPRPVAPIEALQALQAGNHRFVTGQLNPQDRTTVRRAELVEGQSPFAIVLGCSDSRVPPELVFDQGLGGLFTIRVAGNTASDPLVIGSAEYSVSVLNSSLVVVLGHDECGAVKAAIDVVTKAATLPGALPAVVEPIVPAVEAVKMVPPDQLLDAAIEENIRRAVTTLRAVPLFAERIAASQLEIVGAHYRLGSGRVSVQSY